eukprot:TRINITY_DN7531_c0_g1_i1.p1 TRINITY_DN7531_c0_g1~~TRINITY_DN7531_c0_g1_i1.p1  ORF type:complete len:122 (-),score=11.81 TRINITY_DN7531_c0_g1_i1:126-491(-)
MVSVLGQLRKVSAAFMAVLLWCLLVPSAYGFSLAQKELLDRLVQVPYLAALSLSTDGHYLSALRRLGDGAELIVWHADGGPDSAEVLPYRYEDLSWISWVGNGRLLISLNEQGLVLALIHI